MYSIFHRIPASIELKVENTVSSKSRQQKVVVEMKEEFAETEADAENRVRSHRKVEQRTTQSVTSQRVHM